MYKRLQNSFPDISYVSIIWRKLISVTGRDSGRKMMDENVEPCDANNERAGECEHLWCRDRGGGGGGECVSW